MAIRYPSLVLSQHLLLVAAALPANADTTVQCPVTAEEQRLLLVPRINEYRADFCAYLLQIDGTLFLEESDFERLGLRLPVEDGRSHQGTSFFPLHAVSGLEYRVDEGPQELVISGGAEIFRPSQLGYEPMRTVPSPVRPGVFLNYDLHVQHSHSQRTGGGIFEIGLFGESGSGSGSLLMRDQGDQYDWIRLETHWTVDWPQRRRSLRLGDSVSRPGSWGSAVRFGGVQWGTDFSLDPFYSTTASPVLSGEAVLPSTVELYVNNMLALREDVPPGPFQLRDPPVVTGTGEMRLIVRDLLGREQEIVSPFHSSPRLLRPGLTLHDVAAGAVRKDYGWRSNDYGRSFAMAMLRHGLTPTATGEVRIEGAADLRTAGISLSHLLLDWAVVDLTLARSRVGGVAGHLASFRLLRQTRTYSFGGEVTHSSSDYAQLGLEPRDSNRRYQGRVHASWSIAPHGTLGISALYRDHHDARELRAYTLSHRRRIGRQLGLTVSLSRIEASRTDHNLTVNLIQHLGSRRSSRIYYGHQGGQERRGLSLNRNLPPGPGIGYRLLAEDGPAQRLEAGVRGQTDFATFNLEAARRAGSTGYRGGVRGGLVYLGGGPFVSRYIDDSFAVVRTGPYPGVRIYHNNQLVARSNHNALALIPRLRSYEPHRIRVALDDVPMDARIDTPELTAVPRRRSGVLLRFDMEPAFGALIQLMWPDGTQLPAGSVVRLEGVEQTFPVARNGWVYVTGLRTTHRIVAEWQGRRCSLRVSRPAEAGPQPRIGPLTCTEEG